MTYMQISDRFKQIVSFFCLMMIVLMANNAFGNMPTTPTILPDEYKDLPRWCQIRMLSHPAMRNYRGIHANKKRVPDWVLRENKKWEQVIGKDIYNYCHHYCWALNWINRYKKRRFLSYKGVEKDRAYALQRVLAEFRFMRAHLKPKHRLYYSLLINEAYAYSELKDIQKAAKNYIEAIKIRPDFPSAYVKYSQLLNTIGDYGTAKKILQMGFKKTKGAEIIKQALAAMGNAGVNN